MQKFSSERCLCVFIEYGRFQGSKHMEAQIVGVEKVDKECLYGEIKSFSEIVYPFHQVSFFNLSNKQNKVPFLFWRLGIEGYVNLYK